MSFSSATLLRLKHLEYAHISNENDNTTKLITGPVNYTLSSNENIVKPVTSYHVVKKGFYCKIENPVASKKDKDGNIIAEVDSLGQAKTRVGEIEYRYDVKPFPLYPDENILQISQLEVLSQGEALLIHVLIAHEKNNIKRKEGETYLFKGPATYYPSTEEEVIRRQQAETILRGEALHLRATTDFEHPLTKHLYFTGEEYLYSVPGHYFLLPQEVIVNVVKPMLLHDQGVHVEVIKEFKDPRDFAKGATRQVGDTYLVTGEECPLFLPHPYEKVLKLVQKTNVSSMQYCVIVNAAGTRRVVTNTSFYLKPGERMEQENPRKVYILSQNQAVLVSALEDHEEKDKDGNVTKRLRGDRWLIRGPTRLIPNEHVIVERDAESGKEVRNTLLLMESEGVYVRNTLSGEVRLVSGPVNYLLEANEEIFVKPLSNVVRELLRTSMETHSTYIRNKPSSVDCATGSKVNVHAPASEAGQGEDYSSDTEDGDQYDEEMALSLSSSYLQKMRYVGMVRPPKNKRAVVYYIPYRGVTQLYNYKTQQIRIVFGPDRVMLQPDEEFTVISLSGSPWDPNLPNKCLPKKTNHITALHLYLGPSNMSDVVHVETTDHAQLVLQLCYDWYFDIVDGDTDAAMKCFSVNDFVGDACLFIASNIRAAVASMPFEEFHKNSSKLLHEAVFGVDPVTKRAKTELRFPANQLVITSVDLQEMEVSDERTRQGLFKSVEMAIGITTHSQETQAQQLATESEQRAFARLEHQRMADNLENEKLRKNLLDAENKGLEFSRKGKSEATANALSNSTAIEGEASLEASKIRAEKESILYNAVSKIQEEKKTALYEHESALRVVQQNYDKEMSEIKYRLMEKVVEAIGPQTIAEISKAGPELQSRLLSSLGLEGYLVTDGSTPINLFNTAEKMVASPKK